MNLLTGASMVYDVDGEVLEVPENRSAIFWAGIPHQLIKLKPTGNGKPRLANIYLPLDAFLYMGNIGKMQIELLGSAILLLPPGIDEFAHVERWYADYRSNDFERVELLKMELNALYRRAILDGFEHLRSPRRTRRTGSDINSTQTRHVISMLRYILENLDRPITNANIARATGLHANYALTLFSRMMQMPPKRFVNRMRLVRARAMLLESAMPVASVAALAGFTSVSQFYSHFKEAYGTSPSTLRTQLKGAG